VYKRQFIDQIFLRNFFPMSIAAVCRDLVFLAAITSHALIIRMSVKAYCIPFAVIIYIGHPEAAG